MIARVYVMPLLLLSSTLLAAEKPKPPRAMAPFREAAAGEHQKAWAEYLGVPVEVTNNISMKLKLIPAGEFMMGSREPAEEVARVFEVNVSWIDARAFCRWLSRKEAKPYRLPTEAEWEYACRSGRESRYWFGDDPEGLVQVDNVADDTAKERFSGWTWCVSAKDGYVFTAPVGMYRPNPFGLYDAHGNVSEWCSDWYAEDYYTKSPADDPGGPDCGKYRVIRGGSWLYRPYTTRSAYRDRDSPDYRNYVSSFRLARTL